MAVDIDPMNDLVQTGNGDVFVKEFFSLIQLSQSRILLAKHGKQLPHNIQMPFYEWIQLQDL